MANDTTIWLAGLPVGLTVDTWIWNAAGQYYNPTATAYQTYNPASLSSFNCSTPETPSGSGNYACAFPVASVAGKYHWRHTARMAGPTGQPASTDPQLGQGSEDYDGTTFGLGGYTSLLVTGQVNDTSPQAGSFIISRTDGGTLPTGNDYVGLSLCWSAGTNAPAKQQITGYTLLTSTTARVTFANGFAAIPTNGDALKII